ncbi:MAG: hypothetical protein ACI9J3_001451 [Parvicellaceae bacterium]
MKEQNQPSNMSKLIVLLMILISVSAFSQAFMITDENFNDVTNSMITVSTANPTNDSTMLYTTKLYVHNLTSSTMIAKEKRIETTLLPGSSHYQCFGIICYGNEMMGDITIYPDAADPEYLDVETMAANDTSIYRC